MTPSVDDLMTPAAINKLAAAAGLRVMRDVHSDVTHVFPCMTGQTLNHEVKTLVELAQVQAINAVIDMIQSHAHDVTGDMVFDRGHRNALLSMIQDIENMKGRKYGS